LAALTGTIYIVDHEPEEARGMAQELSRAGHHPVVFQSAIEFLLTRGDAPLGCVLLNANLAGVDALQLQAILKSSGSMRPVVVFARNATIQMAVRMLRAGAINFLTVPIGQETLLGAVWEALSIDAERIHSRHDKDVLRLRFSALTSREREVLECVMAGRLNKEIAAKLGTAEKTVKVQRARAMHKLHVRTVPELICTVKEIAALSAPVHPASLLEQARKEARAAQEDVGAAAALPDHLSVGAWDWNIRTDCVIADQNLARLFGVGEAVAGGAPLAAYTSAVHAEDSTRLVRGIRAAIDDAQELNQTYRVCGPAGGQNLILALGRVEYDGVGRPTRFPGVVIDITKYPQLESAPLQIRRHLGQRAR
jgi:FixJ family two-component response regulator